MPQRDETAAWARARVTTMIRRPSDAVFAFVSDPQNDAQWLSNVRGARQLTAGLVGVGSRFRQSAIFLGAPIEGEWEVTEYIGNRRIRIKSVAGPFVFERGYDCEVSGANTLITKSVDVQLSGALVFLTRGAASSLLNKAADRALARLKTILER